MGSHQEAAGSNPVGPVMNMRMPLAAVALFLLLLPAANSLFLVGEGKIGAPFSVLCEGQNEVFVSAPTGNVVRLALDESFQATFTPEAAGPYTIQCGHETKTINAVLPDGQPQGAENVTSDELLVISQFVLFSIAVFLVLMCIAVFYIAKTYLSGRARFSKSVTGSVATLFLRADERMENVEIADPVAFDHKGADMKFDLRALDAGAEWKHEYEISSPEKALPASLTARVNGKEVSMLSELHIEGNGKSGIGKEIGRRTDWRGAREEISRGGPLTAVRKRKLPKA